jgi:predicted N-acetyltransferase YhbS
METSGQANRDRWRPAGQADLESVQKISDEIHVDLPEQPKIFLEKFNLFPEGCLVLLHEGDVVGYSLSHPWRLNSIPTLNQFLSSLPAEPNCLFIHDLAVLPHARGRGAANALIEIVESLARKRAIPNLALVSVYGTYPLWGRFGFEVVTDATLAGKLQAYGEHARYMVRRLA